MFWLRSMIEYIEETYGLSFKRMNTTIIYEYNTMYVDELKGWYIKEDRKKKFKVFFSFTYDLQRSAHLNI